MIKKENVELKNMFRGVGVIILYIILSVMQYQFLSIFGINYYSLSTTLKQVYLILYELGMLAIIVYIYRKDFIPDLKDFKKNCLKYIKTYFKYWVIMLFLMLTSNFIVSMFTTNSKPLNEEIILNELTKYPIYIYVVTVVAAPIIEELVFRLSFRKIFARTKILYILFSGLFFGILHVIGEDAANLLFIIPYSIPGFIFAYIYTKCNNICVPISMHMIHNLTMLLIQLIATII